MQAPQPGSCPYVAVSAASLESRVSPGASLAAVRRHSDLTGQGKDRAMTAGEGGAGRTPGPGTVDVRAVRRHFMFPGRGRIALNNAASTQPPRELLALFASLGPDYENVHR